MKKNMIFLAVMMMSGQLVTACPLNKKLIANMAQSAFVIGGIKYLKGQYVDAKHAETIHKLVGYNAYKAMVCNTEMKSTK